LVIFRSFEGIFLKVSRVFWSF